MFDPILGSESYVMLQRQDTDTSWVYHGKFTVEEFTYELVSSLFGGGKYRGFQKKRNPQGKFVIHDTQIFHIPGPYRPPTTSLPGASQSTEGLGTGQSVATTVGAVQSPMSADTILNAGMMQLLNGMQVMMTSAAAMVQKAAGGGGSSEVTELLKVFLPLLATRDVVDPIDRMQKITEMVRNLMPAATPPTATKEVFDGIDRVLRLKDALSDSGGGDSADPMVSMGSKLLDFLNQQKGNGTVQHPPQPPSGALAPPTTQLPPWQQVLLSNRPLILQSASRGVDADYAASVVMTYLPSELLGIVTEFVQLPNAVQLAVNTIPELQTYPQWTEKFFAALKAEVLEEESSGEEEPPDGPPTGP